MKTAVDTYTSFLKKNMGFIFYLLLALICYFINLLCTFHFGFALLFFIPIYILVKNTGEEDWTSFAEIKIDQIEVVNENVVFQPGPTFSISSDLIESSVAPLNLHENQEVMRNEKVVFNFYETTDSQSRAWFYSFLDSENTTIQGLLEDILSDVRGLHEKFSFENSLKVLEYDQNKLPAKQIVKHDGPYTYQMYTFDTRCLLDPKNAEKFASQYKWWTILNPIYNFLSQVSFSYVNHYESALAVLKSLGGRKFEPRCIGFYDSYIIIECKGVHDFNRQNIKRYLVIRYSLFTLNRVAAFLAKWRHA